MRPMTGCCKGSSPPTHRTGAVVAATTVAGISITAASGFASASTSFWSEVNKDGERCRIIAPSRPLANARDTLPRSRSRLSRKGNFILVLETAAQTKLFRAEFYGAEFLRLAELVIKTGQRINRKRVAIQVVFQIKDTRETGAGKVVFFPRTIFILLPHQVFDGFRNCRITRIGRRQQSDQPPRGLRRRAVALPLGRFHVIAAQRLAKTAVRLLHRLEPGHRTLAIILGIQRNRF